MASFHADVCSLWILGKQNLNKENWKKNSNFNYKEPDPASCVSCEFIDLTGSCQRSGNAGFGLQLLRRLLGFFNILFQKTPVNGLSLLRVRLGNAVSVVSQVRPFLLKQKRSVPEYYLITM